MQGSNTRDLAQKHVPISQALMMMVSMPSPSTVLVLTTPLSSTSVAKDKNNAFLHLMKASKMKQIMSLHSFDNKTNEGCGLVKKELIVIANNVEPFSVELHGYLLL